jgi:signal transduction histidine kinase
MRWPIQIQLLLPMLTVVIMAIILAIGVDAYVSGIHARTAQDENLRRVVATLSEAKFPLTEPVLRQMSGLSGAEFVLFQGGDTPQAATLRLDKDDLASLASLAREKKTDGIRSDRTIQVAGRIYLSQNVPIMARDPASQAGALIVLYGESRWWSAMLRAAYPALAAGTVAIATVIVVTTILAHRFVRPIRRLGDQAAAIAHGQFKTFPVSARNDEIRDLTLSINQMATQLLWYENEVRRNERLRTLGKLGAAMAHQLRNAATGGLMAIELHQRHCPAGDGKESLDVASRQLHLMESYLQRFLMLGSGRAAPFETVSLPAIVEDALELVRPPCAHAGVELCYSKSDADVLVHGDYGALHQMVINLVLNAAEAAASQKDQPAKVSVELKPLDEDRAALCVRDSGPGPAEEVAQCLFEPFVSGKAEGTGLGLFVARQVVEDHHGEIAWRRENNQTCFTVEFPRLKS